MTPLIGIMQGRLSPPDHGRIQSFPLTSWREEFPRAAEAGLRAIEWIYDVEDALANPIGSAHGIAEMRALSRQHGVAVHSLCADYFMPYPFVRAAAKDWDDRLAKFEWLLTQCQQAGVRDVVLPFVDNSRIDTAQDRADVLRLFHHVRATLDRLDLQIHLETSLAPTPFLSLIEEIGNPRVLINYDSGNSSSLGHRFTEEWDTYGQFVGSVHIKDRVKGGTTVPLGTGHADFAALARCVKKFNYAGRFILQVARGKIGEEVPWARQNRTFLEQLLLPAV